MAKPPDQVLRGAGFILHFNPDTAPAWPCIMLTRRAQVITTGGIVKSPIILVRYEIYTDGEIRRVMPDGEPKMVPDGTSEWKWCRDTQAALHDKRPLPPDLVRWGIQYGSRKVEYGGAKLATLGNGG